MKENSTMDILLPILLILVTGGHLLTLISAGGLQEFCHFENFNASCSDHEVIVIKKANYGRMRYGRCVKENLGGDNIGCSANVQHQMDSVCSGRKNCTMKVANQQLHDIHSCSKELVAYLEVSYDCVKVASSNIHQCSVFGGQRLQVNDQPGFIHSSTLPEAVVSAKPGAQYRAGTQSCPWMLEAQKGQRFNLTLFNFTPPDSVRSNTCKATLTIRDGNITKETSLCSRERHSRVYTSRHHIVQLFVRGLSDSLRSLNFLLRYEVFGCSDITNITSATVTRKGEMTMVKCNLTGETFYLTCSGAVWKGELGNCTKAVPLGAEKKKKLKDEGFPYGLLIVIGIGVALGVALGIILLFGILFCLRRRRKPEQPRSHTTDPLLHSETPLESEEAGRESWYSTRPGAGFVVKDVLCPHGLATLARHSPMTGTLQSKSGGHYADSTELHRSMGLGESAATLPPPNGNLVHYPSPEAPCIRRPQSPGRELDEGPEMQTSFITFKPGTPVKGQRFIESENSVDLIKDSMPYRQLNPETLVVECTCTLRPNHGHRHPPSEGNDASNQSV